jgi:hypothetical protein
MHLILVGNTAVVRNIPTLKCCYCSEAAQTHHCLQGRGGGGGWGLPVERETQVPLRAVEKEHLQLKGGVGPQGVQPALYVAAVLHGDRHGHFCNRERLLRIFRNRIFE